MNVHETVLASVELKTMVQHKALFSQGHRGATTTDEAIADLPPSFAETRHRGKLRHDNPEPHREIGQDQWLRPEEGGRDIGRHVAVEEWCPRYAEIWRQERESLERNGFVCAVVVVTREQCRMLPTAALVRLTRRFSCEIYLHKEGMPHYSFLFHGKPYLSVKSILSALSLKLTLGDRLEFLVTGVRAEQAAQRLDPAVNAADPGSQTRP